MPNDLFQVQILCGAISGLGTSYACKNHGISFMILEKEQHSRGLCSRLRHGNFFFDRFAHLPFSEHDEVNSISSKSANDIIRHTSNSYNTYNRKWLNYSAQNNISPLEKCEKEKYKRFSRTKENGIKY